MTSTARLREIVASLCAPECAGRQPGTPEGIAARRVVTTALRAAGLDPREVPVPGCGGANVLATVPGSVDRWIVVGAHYDHLGKGGRGSVYWGADDNAAAVAILAEVARDAAGDREGRGVIVAAFDGEEPPFFLTEGMGSQAFVRAPPVPLASIDFMMCMDVVGHRIGPAALPDEVGASVFALGGEHSEGTADLIDAMGRDEPGVIVRAVDAEIIPPLSDHAPFWRAGIPFLLLSAGRSAVYHTPEDTPEKLDYDKMTATARWLSRFVRATRRRDDRVVFHADAADDRRTLEHIQQVVRAILPFSAEAEMALRYADTLLAACDAKGRLPAARHPEVGQLIGMIEQRLA